MSLFDDVMQQLRSCSAVPVVMDAAPNMIRNKISISRVKMTYMVQSYDILFTLVNKCWSNLPEPPCSEKTHLFMWVIAADYYSLDHSTINWEGSGPNTFAHLWSIIDRMGISLERAKLNWILDTRTCKGYCASTGMTGPLDRHMYPPEYVTPTEIERIDEEIIPLVHEDSRVEFCSFYNFSMYAMIPEAESMVNVSDMIADNEKLVLKRRTGSSS